MARYIMQLAAMAFVATAPFALANTAAQAQKAVTIEVSIKDHRFNPAELKAPAKKPLQIHVRNLDPTPMEFESHAFKVEKVVPGHGEAIVRVRPLSPGRYKFFDDFNQKTGQGVLVVQ